MFLTYLLRNKISNLIFLKDLDRWQTQKRVSEFPSLLAFLGYS